MLTLLFIILMLGVFGKIGMLALKASWGLFKIGLYIICLPLILIVMFVSGLVMIAIPALIIIGIVAIVASANN